MMECYCLSFFTTNKDTLQVTFPNVLCCCPYCWRLSSPFEPAGFLFKNKIIQSLINDQLMLFELLNHCLNWSLNRLTVYIIYSHCIIHFPSHLSWVTVNAPTDNLGYPQENQWPPLAKGHWLMSSFGKRRWK